MSQIPYSKFDALLSFHFVCHLVLSRWTVGATGFLALIIYLFIAYYVHREKNVTNTKREHCGMRTFQCQLHQLCQLRPCCWALRTNLKKIKNFLTKSVLILIDFFHYTTQVSTCERAPRVFEGEGR
jgi:hypothetical protein